VDEIVSPPLLSRVATAMKKPVKRWR